MKCPSCTEVTGRCERGRHPSLLQKICRARSINTDVWVRPSIVAVSLLACAQLVKGTGSSVIPGRSEHSGCTLLQWYSDECGVPITEHLKPASRGVSIGMPYTYKGRAVRLPTVDCYSGSDDIPYSSVVNENNGTEVFFTNACSCDGGTTNFSNFEHADVDDYMTFDLVDWYSNEVTVMETDLFLVCLNRVDSYLEPQVFVRDTEHFQLRTGSLAEQWANDKIVLHTSLAPSAMSREPGESISWGGKNITLPRAKCYSGSDTILYAQAVDQNEGREIFFTASCTCTNGIADFSSFDKAPSDDYLKSDFYSWYADNDAPLEVDSMIVCLGNDSEPTKHRMLQHSCGYSSGGSSWVYETIGQGVCTHHHAHWLSGVRYAYVDQVCECMSWNRKVLTNKPGSKLRMRLQACQGEQPYVHVRLHHTTVVENGRCSSLSKGGAPESKCDCVIQNGSILLTRTNGASMCQYQFVAATFDSSQNIAREHC